LKSSLGKEYSALTFCEVPDAANPLAVVLASEVNVTFAKPEPIKILGSVDKVPDSTASCCGDVQSKLLQSKTVTRSVSLCVV
jgi:hypothetical protein